MLWKTTSKTHSSCEETWYVHVNTLRFAQKHFCDNHTSLLQPHQDNCIVTSIQFIVKFLFITMILKSKNG